MEKVYLHKLSKGVAYLVENKIPRLVSNKELAHYLKHPSLVEFDDMLKIKISKKIKLNIENIPWSELKETLTTLKKELGVDSILGLKKSLTIDKNTYNATLVDTKDGFTFYLDELYRKALPYFSFLQERKDIFNNSKNAWERSYVREKFNNEIILDFDQELQDIIQEKERIFTVYQGGIVYQNKVKDKLFVPCIWNVSKLDENQMTELRHFWNYGHNIRDNVNAIHETPNLKLWELYDKAKITLKKGVKEYYKDYYCLADNTLTCGEGELRVLCVNKQGNIIRNYTDIQHQARFPIAFTI